MVYISILLGIIAGLSVSLQVSFNNRLALSVGNVWTIFVAHAGGAILALLLIVVTRSFQHNNLTILEGFGRSPWYSFTGGVMGVIMVGSVLVALKNLPSAQVLALVVLGQLCLALIIDHFGLFGLIKSPVQWSKILGVILILAGTFLLSNNVK